MNSRDADFPGRSRPILGEEFIRIVAQGIPGLPQIRAEVVRLLASESEFRIREVIRHAKSYMRHSKRSRLTVEDVANASKSRDRQPLLGFGETIEFDAVQGNPGLYIRKDEHVKLTEVIEAELPAKLSDPSIEAIWIAVHGDEIDAQSPAGGSMKLSDWSDKQFRRFFESVSETLMDTTDEDAIEAALKAVATAKALQPVLTDFVSFIRQKVHENARVNGGTEILFNMTRLTYAIFSRERFGVERHYDQLIPALLTCLLGRNLGKGDHWALRDFAAFVLQQTLKLHQDPMVRGRTAKTLVAVLTDKQTCLESLYGAIRGLDAMGEDVFEAQFLPHVPALLYSLERASLACERLEDGLRKPYEEKITRICQLLERANPDAPSDASDVTLLMDVTL